MTDITVPILIFAISVGVPCISFLWILMFLLRKIRKPQKDMMVNVTAQKMTETLPGNRQFHNDLLLLQIDTIFNGLNAIIETERIKINTLIGNNVHTGIDVAHARQDLSARTEMQSTERADDVCPTLDEQIAGYAASGGNPEEIADEMGLSRAEVELALTMHSTRERIQHRKLEAVA